jgi:hypothetical protein
VDSTGICCQCEQVFFHTDFGKETRKRGQKITPGTTGPGPLKVKKIDGEGFARKDCSEAHLNHDQHHINSKNDDTDMKMIAKFQGGL